MLKFPKDFLLIFINNIIIDNFLFYHLNHGYYNSIFLILIVNCVIFAHKFTYELGQHEASEQQALRL